MAHYQAVKACLLTIIIMFFAWESTSQSLDGLVSYSVVPSCDSPDPNKPTEVGKYYLLLQISSLTLDEGEFDISVDGSSVVQFHLASSDLPHNRFIGPFNHTGVGGSYHEYIIRSLDFGGADTLYLPEVVCGINTSNGLNGAGYFCQEGSYGIVAQVRPEALDAPQLPEKTYVYVLVESASNLIADRNFSGQFTALEDLENYEVHAFAIPFDRQADFINSIIIGEELDQNNLDICFALCGIYSLVVDCSSFDLSLEKSVQGGFVYSVGDLVVFDIIVRNDGRVTAYNIVVEDQLPEALTFLPDMNPYWSSELMSHPIDSIQAGSFVNIPIYTRVNSSSGEIDVINEAEITFASNDPENDNPAFDVDSTPDNDDEDEDDQDDAEIIILENLCSATFDIEADNEAVCSGSDLVMMAMIRMASRPLQYRWRKNGTVVSRDSLFIIENHSESDYGEYSLTIIDANGCTGTEYIFIEPIDNEERFSCFTNINVGVNENCEIFLTPDMFTSRPVSAIDDYIIELRDEQNQLVDPSDLSAYLEGAVLEARIINPCNSETICWSNLHIEHKALPNHDIYDDNRFSIACHRAKTDQPTEIIAAFNEGNDGAILSASDFQELFNGGACLQEWTVEVIDEIIEPSTDCSDRTILRVYYIFDQEAQVPVDTAHLIVYPISADSLVMPADLDNLSCLTDISPFQLGSFPKIMIDGKEEALLIDADNEMSSFCNLGISYTDQTFDQSCNFGTYKVVRHWTATDWCSNSFYEDWQYLFIVDESAPDISVQSNTIQITAAPFECIASLDVTDYLQSDDLCDASPTITVFNHTNYRRVRLPLGESIILGSVTDKCGNSSSFTLNVNVTEHSPPVAILKENLTLSLSQDNGIYTNYLDVDFVDGGSHDSDCGPVDLLMARATEILLVESHLERFPLGGDLKNCHSDLSSFDANSDDYLNREELFRKQIVFCCQDIGSYVELIVRVSDQSGNITEAKTSVFIDAKLEWTACDDQDPCTIDDRQYGDCPCSGSPNIEDFDEDNIIDCMDSSITICLNNVQQEVSYDELAELKNKGAIGGPCHTSLMASVAGEIFTRKGDMIEDVLVSMSNMKQDITEDDGYYRFDENEMYQYYELFPERDDDPINGVSTLDLIILQEYILMKREINDPYLLIAADVNNDGKVSALDIVELRKLLLGTNDHFYNNRSWRFVIENFEFDDIRNPYDYRETNVIHDLDVDKIDENWIGIKIGDLNDSALPNSLKSIGRSSEEWVVEIPDISVNKGDQVNIPIRSRNTESIMGLQLSLKMQSLSFLSISSGSIEIHSDQYTVQSSGYNGINMVWHSVDAIDIEDDLFYLSVHATKDGELKDMISLDEWKLEALVSPNNKKELPITLEYVEPTGLDILPSAELYQNQPNPFNGETIIQFMIPKSGMVSISFYDTNGRILLNMSDNYSKGVNALRLTHDDLSLFEGVVFYQMQYNGQVSSRKMIVTK